MINVTKSYLPPMDEYVNYISKIWENNWLTNQGPLATELETKLKEYMNTDNVHYVSNGTIAIELAINALGLKDCEIITTPFSFVATLNSILWQNCKPVFVDINPNNYNIDVSKIEEKITPNTKAILAVHVFGVPCDVHAIDKIAKKHDLKVIYDGAHAFGVEYDGRKLLTYGDVSTCSFHATKVFHTIEGGMCVAKDSEVNKKIGLLMKFGYEGDNYQEIGVNAKNSEFHAAMGLCSFNHLDEIIAKRKYISELYDKLLKGYVKYPIHDNYKYNYIYYTALFSEESEVLEVLSALKEKNINARRYFYPSLNTLKYVDNVSCPVSEDVSHRILCLPLDTYLTDENVQTICDVIVDKVKVKKF